MNESSLHELLAVNTPEKKAALLAESVFFNALTKPASLIAQQCVIFHWFDEIIVESLLGDVAYSKDKAKDIYREIQKLPFIESLLWGQAFNRLTRDGLLQSYTSTQPNLLKTAAKLAAPAYRKKKGESIAFAEAFYCYLVAGDTSAAMELFNEAEQQAKILGNWEYIEGFQELAIEAQRFPFVSSTLAMSRILQRCEEVLSQLSESLSTNDATSGSIFPSATVSGQQTVQEKSPLPDEQFLPTRQEPTVLIVDDSPTVRKIVQMTLQREHIRVITANDGLSALTSVADEIPDVILLDIQLPRMDGYHICQIIRENLHFRHIPIIMLSGKDGLFDKMRGRLAGSTEYLTKPFDSVELVQTVKKHLIGWSDRRKDNSGKSGFSKKSNRKR